MKRILFVILITTMVGCYNEPQSVEHTGKDDKFQIEYLFEKNGIKMYRFYDGGAYHYFTTNGETISSQASGDLRYDETIKTKSKIGDEEYHELKGEIEHNSKF